MGEIKAVAVACDMVSGYGWGIDSCWEGLLSGKTAIKPLERFRPENFPTKKAAVVPGLDPDRDETMVMQMVTHLIDNSVSNIPHDALLILATTNGEIDILEQHILNGTPDAVESRPDYLLRKIERLIGLSGPGMIVSAACASSSTAIAQASAMIRNGDHDCVLVIGCDNVSEFVAAGFASLMALDKDMAHPFDINRRGLSLGEATAFMLLMSDSRAERENRPVIAEIAGWGLTSDANHMTGPSRDGSGLALAVRKALQSASISEDDVGSISAHGTGTVFNDSMEMKAFKSVFHGRSVPTYSIKGGIGHTMGSAGLVDIIVAIKSLKEKVSPGTVNLRDIDDEAKGWASPESSTCDSRVTISTNSGFGGINCAVVLTT